MKKIYKKVIIAVIAVYFVGVLISQQKTLNIYKSAEANYKAQLEEAKQDNEELTKIKSNVSSLDYIEEVAREKLDMYLPNERVYIDIEK